MSESRALGQNANSAAMILAAGLIALIGLAYGRRGSRWGLLLAGLLGAVLGFAVLETGSRGGLASLVGGVLVFALAADTLRARLRNAVIAAFAIALLIVGILHLPVIKNRLEDSMKTGNMAGREQLYPALWTMFLEKPTLGWGPVANTYELAARIGERERPLRAAHNIVLELLTATGIIGTIPFLLGGWLGIRAAWRSRRGPHGVLPLALFCSVLISNMSGDWIAAKLIWVVLAYALASEQMAVRRPEASSPGIRATCFGARRRSRCQPQRPEVLSMCGLAGRFHPLALPPDPLWAGRADALLAHRGPDGRGHYRDERCELVHRRLALIDLSPTGAQPLSNEDGSVQVVFNGEIYNHRELRSELQSRGHRFRGSSDTEVLVHLYEEQGERMASRLKGMFAFALLDRPRNRVVLGRDRFGIKPLFWASHRGQWIFASEMKAILALQGFQPELDRQACYDFLGLSYIPEPATGFANIAALEKGTTLVLDERGARSTTFAEITVPSASSSPRGALAERAAGLLAESVRRQSVADVPVAALLSGGIDSSLVVAAHARSTAHPIQTFNVGFPDREHDETAMALATSRRYGTDHHTIRLDAEDVTPDAVFSALGHFDQPFADPSLVPTYAVAKAVRRARHHLHPHRRRRG